jgi:hypothetical protein
LMTRRSRSRSRSYRAWMGRSTRSNGSRDCARSCASCLRNAVRRSCFQYRHDLSYAEIAKRPGNLDAHGEEIRRPGAWALPAPHGPPWVT